ncbi:MAG: hypothetical protein HN350_14400 [Phycisphaerales bacterium]|jgi:hypothetical protein|nr:hypothetical protein [Phycisphaerales bacterium]
MKKQETPNGGVFGNLISKCETFGPLVAVNRSYIIMFVIVWNVLCGIGVVLNGGTGEITKPAGMFMMALAGAYAAFCGFAPVFSQRIRARWCKEDADFNAVRSQFLVCGAISALVCAIGVIMFARA